MAIQHVADVLVEQADRKITLRAHIPFEIGVEAIGLFGLHGRVAARDRLVAVIHHDVWPQLIIIGAGGTGVERQPQLLGIVDVVVEMQAWEEQCLARLRRYQSRRCCTDRRDCDPTILDMLGADAAQDRTPVIFQRAHQIAGEDLLAHIVIVARYGAESEVGARRRGHRTHLVGIEIAEGVSHRQLAEKPLVERELVVIAGQADRGELCRAGCAVRAKNDVLFVGHLGALVELEARLERRIGAEEASPPGKDELGRIGIGRVDGVEHGERRCRLGEGVDRRHLRARLEARRAAQLIGGEQRQIAPARVTEVIAYRRAQGARRRAFV